MPGMAGHGLGHGGHKIAQGAQGDGGHGIAQGAQTVETSFQANKYVVPSSASDGSTSEPNAPTMDSFRDELATAISLVWKRPTKFIILILHVNLECEFAM